MPDADATILIVEDDPALALVYQGYLSGEPYRVARVGNGAQALASIEREAPDVLLLDLQLPDMNGRKILDTITERGLPTAVIVVTAYGNPDTAGEVMQAGAADYLEKPFSANRLLVTLRNTVARRRAERFVELHRESRFHGFIGASLAMQAVYRIIRAAAHSKATVFITGESGTGKEVCAQAIHAESPRRGQPFIALNCASIPRELMESEVFGHVKGAFTGASSARKGAASQADGGTLFLDEICEMDIDLQSKLLRFIQTSSFQRVGGSELETADIRFICATNRDPLAEVRAGRFREDLYYRLQVIPIPLPPLRQREDDIVLIARSFLLAFSQEEGRHFKRLAPATEALFRGYDWPGNVRQLDNVMRNVVVLHDAEEVTPDMLPAPFPTAPGTVIDAQRDAAPRGISSGSPEVTVEVTAASVMPLWQVEKQAIERAIALCADNVSQAAALLEVSPSTLYRKLRQWQSSGRGGV